MASVAECIGTLAIGVGVAYYFATSSHGGDVDHRPIVEDHYQAGATPVAVSDDGSRSREASIAHLIAEGVFSQVNLTGNAPAVSTGPTWDNLSFEARQVAVSEVAARYSNRDTGLVLIQDGRTGQSIGTFSSPTGGLKLD
jgi:hypothetical protein